MKRIKFTGDARKKMFRNSMMLYETFDDEADSVKSILSLTHICML